MRPDGGRGARRRARFWPAVVDPVGAILARLEDLHREGVDVAGVVLRELEQEDGMNDGGGEVGVLAGALRVRMADGETTPADELARALVALAKAVHAADLAPADLRAARVVDLARALGVLVGGER